MAHIRKKVSADRKKKTYEVRYRIGGKEQSRTFKKSSEADGFKVWVEASRYQGGFVDPRAGSLTVGEFVTEWLNSNLDLTVGTRGFYEMQLRVHIIPRIGDIRLNELSPRDVSLWYSALRKEKGKSVAPKAYVRLKSIMDEAVRQELISATPCTIKNGGAETHAQPVVVTTEEVFALAAAIKPRYSAAVLLKTFGALRTGELLGLRRSDLNFKTGVLKVQKQMLEPKGGGLAFSDPKWGSSGEICLPKFLLEVLAKHIELFAQTRDDGLIFPGDRGGPTYQDVWKRQFVKAKMAAGLPEVTPHGLRHSGLSLAGEAGASIAELQKLARHKTGRAALMYQQPFKDSGSRVAEMFDRMVADAPTQKKEDSE